MSYIKNLSLEKFMGFGDLNISFSPNINIISGENSSGKTIILKILYTSLKSINEANKSRTDITKEKNEEILVKKLQGVFQPDEMGVGRLVNRIQGSNRAEVKITTSDKKTLEFGFGNRQINHVDIKANLKDLIKGVEPIFIPAKEIISVYNFVPLYEEYHIAFEETYYDLAKLLMKPLKKGPNTNEQNRVLEKFENIINAKVIQREGKFYLKVKGSGDFEMGLVSEGYRKLSIMMYLILSGSLTKHSIIFWDEPECNMNPKMVQPIADAMIELAKMGVQIFVTTHDYFMQQCFGMAAKYSNQDLKFNFISLYRDAENNNIVYDSSDLLNNLNHNSIMEEFDNLYNREQELFYES
jgi:predicted ATP-dependent endonuclease of OLD family